MSRLRVTLKTLHLVGLSARLLLVEFCSKFVRLCCSADASVVELMVLMILLSSANVAIFEFFTALERWLPHKRNNGGAIEDKELILEEPLMTLELLSMLHQEWLFARIDLSEKIGTIVECSHQTQIHEDDGVAQRD